MDCNINFKPIGVFLQASSKLGRGAKNGDRKNTGEAFLDQHFPLAPEITEHPEKAKSTINQIKTAFSQTKQFFWLCRWSGDAWSMWKSAWINFCTKYLSLNFFVLTCINIRPVISTYFPIPKNTVLQSNHYNHNQNNRRITSVRCSTFLLAVAIFERSRFSSKGGPRNAENNISIVNPDFFAQTSFLFSQTN